MRSSPKTSTERSSSSSVLSMKLRGCETWSCCSHIVGMRNKSGKTGTHKLGNGAELSQRELHDSVTMSSTSSCNLKPTLPLNLPLASKFLLCLSSLGWLFCHSLKTTCISYLLLQLSYVTNDPIAQWLKVSELMRLIRVQTRLDCAVMPVLGEFTEC